MYCCAIARPRLSLPGRGVGDADSGRMRPAQLAARRRVPSPASANRRLGPERDARFCVLTAERRQASDSKGFVPMHKDQMKGAAKDAKGSVKQAAGKATSDDRLRTEGAADKTVGKVQKG